MISSSTYADQLKGTRSVPCQFKLECNVPNIYIDVKREGLISDEFETIRNSVLDKMRDEMRIESKVEIFLVSNDKDSRCQGHQFTEAIKFIGVKFVGIENTVLQDYLRRLITLKDEVTVLKDEMTVLKDDMTVLKEKDFRVRTRCLIELGRHLLWKDKGIAYREEVPEKYINTSEYFDRTTRKFVIRNQPKSWIHFIDYLSSLNLNSEVMSILSLLDGGESSDFAAYSNEVHGSDQQEIAEAVKYFNGEKEKQLFKFVFGKTVEEATRH